MRLSRFLFLLALIFSGAQAYAADASRDPRPLTDEESNIFVPLVCIHPVVAQLKDEYHELAYGCSEVLGNSDGMVPLVGDDPIEMSFHNVAYSSFTKAGADEAYVTYSSSMEGEGDHMGGGVLFRRENDKWTLVRLIHGGQIDECLAIPSEGKQKMLCLFNQHMCCGTSLDAIIIMIGIDEELFNNWNDKTSLLASHDGRRMYYEGAGDGGGIEFCKAGKEGKTLLLGIDELKHSGEAGIFAEANVQYVTPDEINKACKDRPPAKQDSIDNSPADTESVHAAVRFVLEGDKVKAVLPEGVRSFSVY
jgi:hypothetical protein